MKETFLVLVSAHFIADFLLQPDWLEQRKKLVWANMFHSMLVAGLTYLFLQQWTAWILPILVFVSHGLVDAVKQGCRDTWQSFCVDQGIHALSLLAILWFCLGFGWIEDFNGVGLRWMVLIAGFSVVVLGAGSLVGKVADKILRENGLEARMNGLKDSGRLIGRLERSLIFLFIFIGHLGGIGFLVAAKSILIVRFDDVKKDPKMEEYVLIGTLLSFGLAIAAAALTKAVLKTI
ncbi:MAG: DUF3307 domain-containing protein [Verrucomicrobiota bacterium]